MHMEASNGDDSYDKKLLFNVAGEKRELDKRCDSNSNESSNITSSTQEKDIHHERSPLIRPHRQGDLTDNSGSSVTSLTDRSRRYGAVPRKKTVQPGSNGGLLKYMHVAATLSTRSVSVMSFLLIVVFGIVLTAASNLNTDPNGIQVKPYHVLVYIMLLMTVFVVWVSICILPQKLKYSSRHDSALIPRHLLTGIAIFGIGSTIPQILIFMDFVKCSCHVKIFSPIYGIYPFFKIFFVYFQIYFFYKLSRSGIRDRKMPGGNFFIMVTLATNMCIWGQVFLTDASSDPRMQSVVWLNHYYYGINGVDLCANATITSSYAQKFHATIGNLRPYFCAFSMEYALLATGFLLHIWQSIKEPMVSQAALSEQQNWTLWRLGLILGLFLIPFLFVAYMHERNSERFSTGKGGLYGFLCLLNILLAACSWYCIVLLNRTSDLVKNAKTTQLEAILLAISFIGFPVHDLCCMFASFMEIGNFPASLIAWYALSAVAELVAVSLQFLFVKKAYECKLPKVAGPNERKAAKIIRQFASFALVLNFCYWGSKTYELRKKSTDPTVAETFYGKYAWFALSRLSYPLCIFFHFHLAICFAEVISIFSQFGPLYKSS